MTRPTQPNQVATRVRKLWSILSGLYVMHLGRWLDYSLALVPPMRVVAYRLLHEY